MTIHEFIKKRPYLVWYVSKDNLDKLNEESIVEHVLNYGNWDDVQEMIKILGMEKAAQIFRKQMITGRQRGNYHRKTRHYFNLYFNKYVDVA